MIKKFLLNFLFFVFASTSIFSQEVKFSERKLVEIIQEQSDLIENQSRYSNAEFTRRLQGINSSYLTYLIENPKDVYGYILYGKFMRMAGSYKAAFELFVKADSIDSTIGVVKQQIAVYFAENSNYAESLNYFLQAVKFEPDQALYHEQLASLLLKYKSEFIKDKIFTEDLLDNNMQKAFLKARTLKPKEFYFAQKYADSFYSLKNVDWQKALDAWFYVKELLPLNVEKNAVLPDIARCYLELGDLKNYEQTLLLFTNEMFVKKQELEALRIKKSL